MSNNKVEQNVIDDKLLVDAILDEMLPADAEGLRAAGEPSLVDLSPGIQSLILSFKQIGRIENLVGLDNLTKLCLDNNKIEDVVNIGTLTKLKWLDLSFNKIRKIAGLEMLVDLQDLTLCNNKIITIEGLDHCKKLECLSLGNNRIAGLDQIIKLRQVKSLKMLALAGNPVVQDAECQPITLAYLENLQYLDYALIEPLDRHNAREQYHDELLDVEESESVVNEQTARDTATNEYKTYLARAGCLYAYIIFDSMMDGDSDLEKLKHLPGVKDLVEGFRQSFKAMSEEFLKGAVEKYEVRAKEVTQFEGTVKTLRSKDDDKSTGHIDAFNKQNRQIVLLLTKDMGPGSIKESPYSPADVAKMVGELISELDLVCDKLMTLELAQVEKFDTIVDDFDNRLNEMKNIALEMQQTFFRAIEAMEEKFFTDVAALIVDLMSRLAREELSEDYLDDEAMTLLMDKESCMGVLGLSHDAHIGKILKLEDEARNIETKAYQSTVQGHMTGDRDRNRARVLEIHEYCRSAKLNINALLVNDEDAEEEDAQ